MGYDARCTIRVDGKAAQGTAWLEHKDLIFRGPFRLAIPLKDIRQATAHGGTLRVRYAGKSAELDIGDHATRWAERITHPPSRLEKLGIKAGIRVALLGAPIDDGGVFAREIEARGAAITTRKPAPRAADVVFFGAERREDLGRLAELSGVIPPDGAIWVLRPKGRASITEADTMAAGKAAGLVDVKVVSFSDSHTAEKFVIPVSARPRVTTVAKRAAPVRSSPLSPRKRESSSSRGRS